MSLLRKICCCIGCIAARCIDTSPGNAPPGSSAIFCRNTMPPEESAPTPQRLRLRLVGITWPTVIDCGTGEEDAGKITIIGTPPEEICVELLSSEYLIETDLFGTRWTWEKTVTLPFTVQLERAGETYTTDQMLIGFFASSAGFSGLRAVVTLNGEQYGIIGNASPLFPDPPEYPRLCCQETTWDNAVDTAGCDSENFPNINIAGGGQIIITPCAECNPLP